MESHQAQENEYMEDEVARVVVCPPVSTSSDGAAPDPLWELRGIEDRSNGVGNELRGT